MTDDRAILSFRSIITLSLIIIGTLILILSCMAFISLPCVSNFYNQLPEYPGADLIEQHNSTLNWIAIGELEFVYHTEDNLETVEAWFNQTVDAAHTEARHASISGEPIPVTWNHYYTLIPAPSGGTNITLTASCLN